MKILVVEDELEIAELLRRALEGLGNDCLIAPDANAADSALDGAEPIEAVTLDLTIPGRDGLQWLEEVAVSRPNLARKTLVITGRHLAPDAVARLARCGAGLLAKPFTLDALQDAVRAQLAHAAVVDHD